MPAKGEGAHGLGVCVGPGEGGAKLRTKGKERRVQRAMVSTVGFESGERGGGTAAGSGWLTMPGARDARRMLFRRRVSELPASTSAMLWLRSAARRSSACCWRRKG